MSVQVLASQSQTPITRPSANYTPSIWGDHFLSYTHAGVDSDLGQQLKELKREVTMILMAPAKEASEKLNLVDDIQRLGVSYHFENQIEQILDQIYVVTCGSDSENDDDLCTTALRFRLLRQQGYNVSADIFNKFKEENNQKFKEDLHSDVAGLLSLYEAAHLRVHNEDILEEALTFATTHLESLQHYLSPSLSKQVRHSLNQPLRKGITRVEARYYLSIYHEHESHNATLLTFAKLDFNMVQQVHQKELSEMTRWWKELDVRNELPFTRDRVTEVYFCWASAICFEPEYGFARTTLCKVTALTSILDDIYDLHGTLEELDLFTEAIERWDIGVIDALPNYMKVCYKALLDVYTEVEEELAKQGNLYMIDSAIEAMKLQARSYHLEAKWFHQKYTPTLDEYIDLASLTSGYPLLITTTFVTMGNNIATNIFDWLATYPKPVKGSAVVARLMDDLVSHKFEQERGHVESAVECYMKEFSSTEEEAVFELRRKVSDAWKDMNESFLVANDVPRSLLIRILNFATVMDVVYKYEDGYTTQHGMIKDLITSVLIEKVPV